MIVPLRPPKLANRVCAAIVACVAIGWSSSVIGQESPDDVQAIEKGRDALRKVGRAPWYDSDRDALRPIAVAPRREDKGSRGTWEPAPSKTEDPNAVTTPTTTATGANWGLSDVFGSLLRVMIYAVLAAAVGLILYLLYRWLMAFREEDVGRGLDAIDEKKSTLEPDRVEELPFEVQASTGNLLDEARRRFAAGDLDRAIVYLYGYQLVELDKRQMIELEKGKTNRQYLNELRPKADMRRAMEEVVLAFEDVFFGRHSLDRPRFERIWAGVDGFHRMLETPA